MKKAKDESGPAGGDGAPGMLRLWAPVPVAVARTPHPTATVAADAARPCAAAFTDGDPAVRECTNWRLGADCTLVALGGRFTPAGAAALLDGARGAARTGGRLVLLHAGAGGNALLATLAREQPAVRCLAIEVPAGSVPALRTAYVTAVTPPPGATEVLVDHAGTVSVTGWEPACAPDGRPPVSDQEAVVITGGLGGLGLALARWLNRRWGVRPVLVDRAPHDRPELARLTRDGTAFTVIGADVTDVRGLAARLRAVQADRPVGAVVHCAGVIEGAQVCALDAPALARLVEPKVTGLRAVLDAVDPASLRSVLAYGSILARRPHRGTAAYALANELLRREVARCTARHRVTAEWSIWEGAGVAAETGAVAVARRAGYVPVPLREGLRMAERLLAWPGPGSSVVVSSHPPSEGMG